jgi:hypothetical protein
MRTRTRAALTASVALLVPLGCAGDDNSPAAVPTVEQLAARLLEPDSLDGNWTLNPGPDDAPMPTSGVIDDAARAMLPSIELCPAASDESRAAANALAWTAFRQLDMTPDDPISPPADRKGHMVFVQQFLLADDPTGVQATFELLRDGMRACLGEIDTGDEGPGVATELVTPGVGDDRYGVLVTMQEAGGRGEWLLHNTLVRKGSVLMLLDVVDIHIEVDPLFTTAALDDIVTTATERL